MGALFATPPSCLGWRAASGADPVGIPIHPPIHPTCRALCVYGIRWAACTIPGLRKGDKDGAVVEETKLAMLRNAAELIGHDQLALKLKIPRHLLDAWMRGQATMPDRKVSLLADVLLRYDDDRKK